MNLRIVQVDAFADRPFTGNPAAVMPLEEWLPDEILQAIAGENNLSETAFTIKASGDADYELRWFTPAIEVALCGHATLASGHVLMGDGDRIRFRTRKAGLLEVGRDPETGGYALSLPAWKPEPKPLPAVLAALGLSGRETLWHASRASVTVLENEAEILALRPNFRALGETDDIITIATAPGRSSDVVSRVFAVGGGIDEDPVTGWAHAVIAPYWAERLGRSNFTAFQASMRGGRLTCRLEGDRAILGGQCVTVMEGVMRIEAARTDA
jgi:PhzF family phenazine biosynthesis protein